MDYGKEAGGEIMSILVAFEMISEDMAEYLADMNPLDRELMVLDHKIMETFQKCGVE